MLSKVQLNRSTIPSLWGLLLVVWVLSMSSSLHTCWNSCLSKFVPLSEWSWRGTPEPANRFFHQHPGDRFCFVVRNSKGLGPFGEVITDDQDIHVPARGLGQWTQNIDGDPFQRTSNYVLLQWSTMMFQGRFSSCTIIAYFVEILHNFSHVGPKESQLNFLQSLLGSQMSCCHVDVGKLLSIFLSEPRVASE